MNGADDQTVSDGQKMEELSLEIEADEIFESRKDTSSSNNGMVDKNILDDKLEISAAEEKVAPQNRRTSNRYQFIVNPDPLAYLVGALCLMLICVGLVLFYLHHSRIIDGYRHDLAIDVRRLDALIASVDGELDEPVVESSELIVVPQSVQTEPNTQETEAAVAVTRIETPADAVDKQNPVPRLKVKDIDTELDELNKLVVRQTEQIDFLATENHELRLLLEFGSRRSTIESEHESNVKTEIDQFEASDTSGRTDTQIMGDPQSEVLPIVEVLYETTLSKQKSYTGSPVSDSVVEREWLIDRAYSHYLDGAFVMADSLYQRVLAIDPRNRDSNLGVAAIAVFEGRQTTAIDIYRQLLTDDPYDQVVFEAFLQLADSTNNIGDELLEHIEGLSGVDSLHVIVGDYHSRERQWSQAVASYQIFLEAVNGGAVADAVLMGKSLADVLYNLAVSLEHLGREYEAALKYQQALDTNSKFSFDRDAVKNRLLALRVR